MTRRCSSALPKNENNGNIWQGIVRFNSADMFINLHNALPGLYVTWIPYFVLPNLGIPVMIVQCSNDDVITPNGSSIYAHRGEITNSNAEIIYREGETATGHEYTFCSKEQKAYIDWAKASWNAYKAEHNNASIAQWAKEVNYDKAKANDLDPDLMERINVLFNNAKG